MKVTIEFTRYEDSDKQINAALQADLLALTIWEVEQEIFKLHQGKYSKKQALENISEVIRNRIPDINEYTE